MLPVPPLVDDTVTELSFAPAVVPVTLTENVQLPVAGIVAPDKLTVLDPAVAVMAPPPQLPVNPFGVETTRPAGSVSVKATPVSDTALAAGLVIVKLNVVVPFKAMFAAPNDLAITGGATTTSVAVAGAPLPPSVDDTTDVVFTLLPAVVPDTFTENVHVDVGPGAGPNVAPDRLTRPEPAVAVIVPPPQLPAKPFGAETTKPAGRVSVKPTPLNDDDEFGFATVKVNVVDPFNGTDGAPNDFVRLGGATTVTDALAVFPVPALADDTVTELFLTPALVPVTLTENEHIAPPARVALARLTVDEPAVAVMVPPPHEPVRPFGAETTSPAGRVSVKPIPVEVPLPAGFVTVKDRVVDPFSAIDDTPNDLVIWGAPTSLSGSHQRVARCRPQWKTPHLPRSPCCRPSYPSRSPRTCSSLRRPGSPPPG